MNSVEFLRGEDIGLFVDGKPFGGVTKFECSQNSECFEVKEFLTSKPFHTQKSVEYEIVIEFAVTSIDSAELLRNVREIQTADKQKRVIYSECELNSLKYEVHPNKRVSCTARIKSEKREAADG